MAQQRQSRSHAEDRWGVWMAAAQSGDRVAYERLLRELLLVLRGFVAARLHDSGGVEDVVQNVLLSVHQARHTYHPERPFAPWLFAIARNAVTDALRARSLRRRRELALTRDVPEPRAESRPEAPLAPELRDALSSLPHAQREAVELIHLHELSVAEAAARVGISPGALKVRAHRGYKALRARLQRWPE